MVMHHAHHMLPQRREDKELPHAPDIAAIQAWAASWVSLGRGSLCPRRLGWCVLMPEQTCADASEGGDCGPPRSPACQHPHTGPPHRGLAVQGAGEA